MQVAVPHLKPRILPSLFATGKNLPLEMLRAGWGSVYEQAGAEYGARGVEEFLRVQSEAQYVLSPHTIRLRAQSTTSGRREEGYGGTGHKERPLPSTNDDTAMPRRASLWHLRLPLLQQTALVEAGSEDCFTSSSIDTPLDPYPSCMY